MNFEFLNYQFLTLKEMLKIVEEKWKFRQKKKSNFDSVVAIQEWFSSKRTKSAMNNGPMILEKAESIKKNA